MVEMMYETLVGMGIITFGVALIGIPLWMLHLMKRNSKKK